MKIAFIGQPNAGKSTLFNSVAGYKSATSNLPGTTVNYTESRVRINGDVHDIIDFPGTYSLSATNDAEAEVRKYLLTERFDLIINIIDASQMGRSLPLTLELMELKVPMIIALNMVDEAQRKGIDIDVDKLSAQLQLPVQSTIASKNIGVRELFYTVRKIKNKEINAHPPKVEYQADIAVIIDKMTRYLEGQPNVERLFPNRFIAVKLLEDDDYFLEVCKDREGKALMNFAAKLQAQLEKVRGRSKESVLVLERHALAMEIYEAVVTIGHPHRDWREILDEIVMHRVGGYAILLAILLIFFYGIFEFGSVFEEFLLAGFEQLNLMLENYFVADSFIYHFVRSIVWGISGGIAIVLPYLVPFLVGLTILEDAGYLPRVAFLMDAFMHRIGLHGTSIIPAMLGYGCNVPAVMATRILNSRRDKIIAAVVASMIPCSARSIVIFGLVAFYLGPLWAFGIYILNIIVIGISGKILSNLMPEVSPGMVLEIPAYRLPSFQVIKKKTWFRIKEFIVVAWPILIAGSIVLGLLEYFQLDIYLNQFLAPITKTLGLPAIVGTTLIFGVLRKELSLIMLTQALGTNDIIQVLDPTQILTFTVFVTFYIPCVATMAVLVRELDKKWMMAISAATLVIAFILAGAVRTFGIIFNFS